MLEGILFTSRLYRGNDFFMTGGISGFLVMGACKKHFNRLWGRECVFQKVTSHPLKICNKTAKFHILDLAVGIKISCILRHFVSIKVILASPGSSPVGTYNIVPFRFPRKDD